MKKLSLLIALLMLTGCASTLVYERDKYGAVRFEASDYSVKITKTGAVAAIPSRWFNANSIGGLIQAFFQNLAPLVTRPDPIIIQPEPTTPTEEPTTPTEPVTPVEPTPTPTPVEPVTPTPVATDTVFTVSGNLITLDLERVPQAMHDIGIPGGALELWYSIAHVYAFGPGREMVSELAEQNPYRQQIFDWFDGEVLKIIALMKSNKALSLIAISNDGKDRCGFRLGPAIVERVLNDPAISASRVQVGNTLSPENY